MSIVKAHHGRISIDVKAKGGQLIADALAELSEDEALNTEDRAGARTLSDQIKRELEEAKSRG